MDQYGEEERRYNDKKSYAAFAEALNMLQPLGMPPVNTGAIGITSPSALGVPGQQTFGALPGNPGSATYDPNAALPSLGNSGSAIAPDQGSSATGVNTPSTNVNGGM